MGRKGGGQKGFLKGVRRAAQENEEPQSENVTEPSTPTAAEDVGHGCPELAPEPGPSAEEDLVPPPKAESKSQLRARHKKELQTLKKKCAQMGKKKKEEAAALLQDMKDRHEQELRDFSTSDANEEDDDSNVDEGSSEPVMEASAPSLYGSGPAGKMHTGKMTKSQKRREKAAQKLADRDARIAEEQASMGESDRSIEERTLNGKLEPLGFKVFDVKADGHCLYRAVNHQLRDGSAIDKSYEKLRKLAADFMRQNRDDFQPFLEVELETDLDDAFERHCVKVESTAEWGGELELRALAHALERAIVVYSVDLPDTTLGDHNLSKDEPLRICFMRHAYGLGNHYNSVEPL